MKILKTSCTRVHGFEQKSKLRVPGPNFEEADGLGTSFEKAGRLGKSVI